MWFCGKFRKDGGLLCIISVDKFCWFLLMGMEIVLRVVLEKNFFEIMLKFVGFDYVDNWV